VLAQVANDVQQENLSSLFVRWLLSRVFFGMRTSLDPNFRPSQTPISGDKKVRKHVPELPSYNSTFAQATMVENRPKTGTLLYPVENFGISRLHFISSRLPM
jgi:hypothetical protein